MQKLAGPDEAKALRKKRLHDEPVLAPWVQAGEQLTDVHLYWVPVTTYPWLHDEKVWLSEFLTRFSRLLAARHQVRAEIFLQYKSLGVDQSESFRKYAQKAMILPGLGRFADNDLPSFPTAEQVKEAVKDGKDFDFREWIGDYILWFATKQPEQQRELFAGIGGMTTVFLPPDPKTAPPAIHFTPEFRAAVPVFQKIDVDGMIAGTYALQDAFLEKSKQLFGGGLEEKAEYPGLMFILPLLDSSHFFAATEELRSQWFDLFEVYVNESKKDNGVLLAFKKPIYEETLLEVLDSMRQDGLQYRVSS